MFCIKKGQNEYCINQKPQMSYNKIINTFLTEMKNYENVIKEVSHYFISAHN